jgi:hypothetical protein
MSGALALPPTPAAVARYFESRRSRIIEFTPADIEVNEHLWVVETCGLPAALHLPVPAALGAENGGSTAGEVVPVVGSPDPSFCGALW